MSRRTVESFADALQRWCERRGLRFVRPASLTLTSDSFSIGVEIGPSAHKKTRGKKP